MRIPDEQPPAPYHVVLYYKYVAMAPDEPALAEVIASHERLCQDLGLLGRVRIAREGINGTLGGPREAVEAYIAHMRADPRFADVDWKTSTAAAAPFAELLVRRVDEIVALGLPAEAEAACDPTRDGAAHLPPADFHAAALEPGADLALIDVRNHYEYNIGHFDGALNPQTRRFSDFPAWVRAELPRLQEKDKILMYCTGGIRCEKASAYLQHLGLRNVFQLEGGIHRYLEAFPDGGLFRGKNFVFDQRTAMASAAEDAAQAIAGRCERCRVPYDQVTGLRCQYCRTHVLICADCRGQGHEDDAYYCEAHEDLVRGSREELRAKRQAIAAQLAGERGHGRKGKRRSLRKQLAVVDGRIAALANDNDNMSTKVETPEEAVVDGGHP